MQRNFPHGTLANPARKAVILAAGKGSRMRRPDATAELAADQTAVAEAGLKALIPVGRPFLDYALHSLAEAGIREICLVVGADHGPLRGRYAELSCRRLAFEFAVQERPEGTADALLRAREFAGDDSFLVVNSDNYYPPEVLRRLASASESGLVGFERRQLAAAGSNIDAARLAHYAVLETDGLGYLRRILEKADSTAVAGLAPPVLVSMNCWRFEPRIFAACRAIEPSPRGELELPAAVQYAIDSLGQRFRVGTVPGARILDLSYRRDVQPVARLLADVEVDL